MPTISAMQPSALNQRHRKQQIKPCASLPCPFKRRSMQSPVAWCFMKDE
jgi:hypothetical protein